MAYATIAGSKEMGSRIKNQRKALGLTIEEAARPEHVCQKKRGQKPGADMKAERQYGQINGKACVKR